VRAAAVVLVEVSPVLRRQQQEALRDMAVASVGWLDRFDDLDAEAGPLIVVANEFFDALPIRQFVRVDGQWVERCVGLNDTGDLVFGAAPGGIAPEFVPECLRDVANGSVIELASVRSALANLIGERIQSATGAVLTIDYGYAGPAAGDTLQAVKSHAYADVLAEPGAADVTSHVDFAALGDAFAEGGAVVAPLVDQGEFLQRLGAQERIEALKRTASALQAEQLEQAYQRLTGAQAMGSLFKVLCACAPATLRPAGFSSK
jgi:NADH dehydrogenase [ubiquinone] 1 alpha subcomplex assembly factor 7